MPTRRYLPTYFLPPEYLPAGFQYPDSYRQFAASGRTSIGPVNEDWYILDEPDVKKFVEYANRLAPHLHLVPFMRRNGEDGVVCFGGISTDGEPKIYGFNYCVDIGYGGGKLTFLEWLATVPPEDEEET